MQMPPDTETIVAVVVALVVKIRATRSLHRLVIDPDSPAGQMGAGAAMNYTGDFPALPAPPEVS